MLDLGVCWYCIWVGFDTVLLFARKFDGWVALDGVGVGRCCLPILFGLGLLLGFCGFVCWRFSFVSDLRFWFVML